MNNTAWTSRFYDLAIVAVKDLERRTGEEQQVATVVVGVSLGTVVSILLVLSGCLVSRFLPACIACSCSSAGMASASRNASVGTSLDSDASSEDEDEDAAAKEAQKRSRNDNV